MDAKTVKARAEEHWATETQVRAYDRGRRVFTIKPNGDPYSTAWEASEFVGDGWVYRGDISSRFGRDAFRRFLRHHYRGCLIREER